MLKIYKIFRIPQYLILYTILLLELSHNSLLNFKALTPYYEVVLVFCWCSILNYNAFSVLPLIIFGLSKDLLLLQPLGLSCIELLAAKYIIYLYRVKITERTFYSNIGVFAALLLVISTIQIVVFAFWNISALMLLKTTLTKLPITILLYFLLYTILTRFSRARGEHEYV